MAIIGLLSLIAISRGLGAEEKGIHELGEEDAGKTIVVRGGVRGIYESAGNLAFRICARKCVQVFVPCKVRELMAATSVNSSTLKNGDRALIAGVLRKSGSVLRLVVEDYNSLQGEGK